MKHPHIYVKFWKLSELDRQDAKFGLGWWVVADKPKDRRGLEFFHPWGRIDLTFTTNLVKYEQDIEPEYRGKRLM